MNFQKTLKRTLITVVAWGTACLFCLSAQKNDGKKTTQENTVWETLLKKYSAQTEVGQLLFVKCTGGAKADVEYYVKDGDGKWKKKRSEKGEIGKKGLGKTKEGDWKTPEGEFGVRQAFGIKPNPGSKIKYYKVTNDTYCCGDKSKYYNTIIEASKLGHKCSGEHLIKYHPQYDYGFETTYNNKNMHGLGSAIFVHCKGKSGYTAGCIALNYDFMKFLVQDAESGIKICIHKK